MNFFTIHAIFVGKAPPAKSGLNCSRMHSVMKYIGHIFKMTLSIGQILSFVQRRRTKESLLKLGV